MIAPSRPSSAPRELSLSLSPSRAVIYARRWLSFPRRTPSVTPSGRVSSVTYAGWIGKVAGYQGRVDRKLEIEFFLADAPGRSPKGSTDLRSISDRSPDCRYRRAGG